MEKISSLKKAVWRTVNEENKTFITKFIVFSDLSKNSMKQYENTLKNFLIWNKIENNDKDLRYMEKIDIKKYFNYLIVDEKLKSSSIRLKKNVLSALFSYLNTKFEDSFRGNIITSVDIDYDLIDDNAKNNSVLKISELRFLEKHLLEDGKILQIIYLLLCYNNNLKLEDLCNIKREIINAHRNKYGYYIYSVKRKNNTQKPKIIYISEDLMDYIQIFEKTRNDSLDSLFISQSKSSEIVDTISISAFSYWCRDIFSTILNRKINHSNIYKKSNHKYRKKN